MDFGESFARAIVLALNPRVNLNRRPMARLDPYYEAAHNATTKEEKIDVARRFINGSLTQKYAHGLPFDLCLFQNSGDEAYWNNQFSPFVEVAAGDNRLFVRTENTGSGHTPVPKELVHEMLSRLASGDDQEIAIKSAGFSRTEGSFKTTTRRLYFRVLRKGQRDVRTGQAWIAKLMGRRTERDS